MKRYTLNSTSKNRSPAIFLWLVFLFSFPFWAMGPVAERFLDHEELLMGLPISSLMVFAPAIAAVVLVRREKGPGAVKELLKRAFDYKEIKRKAWYVPIFFLMPAMMVVQYGWMKLMRVPLPDPQLPFLMVPVSFGMFFIAALSEEVGWQGYAIEPLQNRWNALTASVILGIIWAGWHIVPLIQAHRAPVWITWQCITMVVARILIVWLCNNTGKSVSAAILFHAMINVSTVLLPNYGWPYDPFVALIILAVAAALVTFLWGPKTLASYRYARPGGDVQPEAGGSPGLATDSKSLA
ncbi:MAG: CPBP family intramembrane metalloprotease [Anaerolineales bacterium]|nr:MAG: CPBP family intramembrane metalloprotease [Anaerolineales bacterium]